VDAFDGDADEVLAQVALADVAVQGQDGRLRFVHGRAEERVLGREAIEDAALGHAGALGDVDGAGLGEAVGQELRAGGVEDLLVGDAGRSGHF
jgi:hypothetical protein